MYIKISKCNCELVSYCNAVICFIYFEVLLYHHGELVLLLILFAFKFVFSLINTEPAFFPFFVSIFIFRFIFISLYSNIVI